MAAPIVGPLAIAAARANEEEQPKKLKGCRYRPGLGCSHGGGAVDYGTFWLYRGQGAFLQALRSSFPARNHEEGETRGFRFIPFLLLVVAFERI
jgi:hypothetical protein